MQIGVQQVFQSYGYEPPVSDAEVYEDEIALALLADELGFDSVWPVEHHFTDYAFCPDNVVYLAYLAGRTTQISLGTGAVIMPWNDPLRVAEKISLLDQLSGGRALFGMGRGLARCEYEGMGVPMDQARSRFDESAAMVLDALASGVIKGGGEHYPQEKVRIRPEPTRSFRDRCFSVAMSPDSVTSAAELGVRMVVFAQKTPEETAASFDAYRAKYEDTHGVEAPNPVVCQFMFCDTDQGRCREEGSRHALGYLSSVLEHYELVGDHFDEAKGYESYAEASKAMQAAGQDRVAEVYLEVQGVGTPEELIEQTRSYQELWGSYDLTCCFRYSGISGEVAQQSMRTFAEHVMPVLRGG